MMIVFIALNVLRPIVPPIIYYEGATQSADIERRDCWFTTHLVVTAIWEGREAAEGILDFLEI